MAGLKQVFAKHWNRFQAKLNRRLPTRRRRLLFWVLTALACFLLVDGLYLACIWPDWDALKDGPVPKSQFIAAYEARQRGDKTLP